jgi:hypothetical protein
MKKLGYSFMGVGLTGTILSCLTMNAVIATGAVVVLVLSLILETMGIVFVTISDKRDALARPSKVYHVSTEHSRSEAWLQWKYNCNLSNRARRCWDK